MRVNELTGNELANPLRLLLQPWNKRGILTITDRWGHPLRVDLGESNQIKDIAPKDIHSNTRGADGAKGVGDEGLHSAHGKRAGHDGKDEAC